MWIQRRSETGMARTAVLALIALGFFAVLALPWQQTVSAQAWLHAEQSQTLYSPFAAQVQRISANGNAPQGTLLVELSSPDAVTRASQLTSSADVLRRELAQSVGLRDGAERRNLIIEQLATEMAALASERGELQRLRLTAPFDGQLVDRDTTVQPGTWVSANQPLGVLIDPSSWTLDALVDQEDIDRIKPGAQVSFYRQNATAQPLAGTVHTVDRVVAQSLPDPIFAAQAGGQIATVQLPDGRIAPRDAMYRVRIKLDQSGDLNRQPSVQLGTVKIAGDSRSPLLEWLTSAAAVLVRESGF